MGYRIFPIVFSLVVMLTTGCRYHLRSLTLAPIEMNNIIVHSYDPYGQLTRAILAELSLSNIITTDNTDKKNKALPLLHIVNASENKITISVLHNGKTAEYQMILSVQALVFIPGNNHYPINITVYRSFFNNQIAMLTKDAEEDVIRQEMREQAAQQLVHKFLTTYIAKVYNQTRGNVLQQLAAPKIQ